ncbi:MAG: DNA replication/repair protein RecF [Brevinema sp.]
MNLEELKLIQFRSFPQLTLNGFDRVNAFIGENGSGKTNVLEAIYLLSSGRGFRTSDRKELATRGHDDFYLGGVFDNEKIEKSIGEKKKKIVVNENPMGAGELRSYNPIVVFNPSDIYLSSGTSAVRRRFFDSAIALVDPTYTEQLLSYERALRQRNASLKKDPANADLWNPALIQNGTELIKKRIQFAKKLVPKIEKLYQEFAGGIASLKYFNNFSIEAGIEKSLGAALAANKSLDLKMKHTGKGPHRDDVSIFIDGVPAAISGSQGQNRALAFAMKIGSVEIVEETLGRRPILLIDDALLETDSEKRKRIYHKMRAMDLQIFLTATEKEFLAFTGGEAKSFMFSQGKVSS